MTQTDTTVSISEALGQLMPAGVPFHFTAYDGSSTGPENARIGLELLNKRGLSYLLTAPGDLGFACAYVAGDLALHGMHEGNPYEAMVLLMSQLQLKMPTPPEALRLLRSIGFGHLKPPPPPPEEHLPKWRRALESMRHSKNRDAWAIQHHYDVSKRFYELVLGPSMTYTCALYPTQETTLEEAQFAKYDLIAKKLDLRPGQRLLDIGCGWGGMVLHAAREYGIKALGDTLSREQSDWATEAIKRERLDHLAEVRFMDYRDVTESDFDAISSIGLAEHIGVRNYPAYFRFMHDHMRTGGRVLNHCITRPHNNTTHTGAFIDRYVFPDGEPTGVGRIVSDMQDQCLEVRHVENLREHYATTLKGWSENLAEHWDEALREVSLGRARVWGIYMAGSRLAFERNEIQLHHVLGVKPGSAGGAGSDGVASFPLRPTWVS